MKYSILIVLFFSWPAFAGGDRELVDESLCFNSFDGVPKADLHLLIKKMGGPKGVQTFLKIQSADFINFENQLMETKEPVRALSSNHKNSKLNQKYWKSYELSKKATQSAILSEKVVAVKKNIVVLLGKKFKMGTIRDKTLDINWFALEEKNGSVLNIAGEKRFNSYDKAFTDQDRTLYVVNTVTGTSIQFILHDLKPFKVRK